jgi:hypothetical protein
VQKPETTNPGPCPNNYTVVRRWIASDACGNQNTQTQEITVFDNSAPVLQGVPDNTSAECDSIPSAPTVVADDNCDADKNAVLSEVSEREVGKCDDGKKVRP